MTSNRECLIILLVPLETAIFNNALKLLVVIDAGSWWIYIFVAKLE